MMDGVPSKVNVLLQIVSYPLLMFFLRKVSNPESLAPELQEEEGISICGISLIWCHKRSWSWHQNFKRRRRYNYYQYKSVS